MCSSDLLEIQIGVVGVVGEDFTEHGFNRRFSEAVRAKQCGLGDADGGGVHVAWVVLVNVHYRRGGERFCGNELRWLVKLSCCGAGIIQWRANHLIGGAFHEDDLICRSRKVGALACIFADKSLNSSTGARFQPFLR